MFWLAPIYAINREYAYPDSITPYATYRSRKLAVWRRRRRHFLITITAGMTYPHVRLAGCAAGTSIRSGQMLWICWIYAGVFDGVGDCAAVRTGPRRGHPVGSLANSRRYPGIERPGRAATGGILFDLNTIFEEALPCDLRKPRRLNRVRGVKTTRKGTSPCQLASNLSPARWSASHSRYSR
jgi:hypothetical protein